MNELNYDMIRAIVDVLEKYDVYFKIPLSVIEKNNLDDELIPPFQPLEAIAEEILTVILKNLK